MNETGHDRRTLPDGKQENVKESTLLPMLIGGLVLIVIGSGVVMIFV